MQSADPSGVNEFERFRQMVLADEALFLRLCQTPDLESFANSAVEAGRSRGCIFNAQQVISAVQQARSEWWLQEWI